MGSVCKDLLSCLFNSTCLFLCVCYILMEVWKRKKSRGWLLWLSGLEFGVSNYRDASCFGIRAGGSVCFFI